MRRKLLLGGKEVARARKYPGADRRVRLEVVAGALEGGARKALPEDLDGSRQSGERRGFGSRALFEAVPAPPAARSGDRRRLQRSAPVEGLSADSAGGAQP